MSTTEKDLTPDVVEAAKTADTLDSQTVEEPQAEEEKELTRKLKMEEAVLRYFQNKEIAKERNEENKLLLEELEALFQEGDKEEVVIVLPNGDHAVLSPKFVEREVLDRDLLAEEMQVPKDELKTPFDFCMFTAQGKLTPEMITRHTTVEREVKMKISKRKPTSRRRKSTADLPEDLR
ncbi:hypothetical protein JI721_13435 [Alicyclobacillus cycloheptanicus]|uniref:Uncharacterized protein n=1 Tax=Alicyclobacillus cycloheptanicus TaxID=1457 RepID=A0ABT9XEB0_9BACL|nr:hypothetical protein [Alicyclobacillus cycloheptanicus]MDQ0188633.1 hypothetical protein [Alicyclobacillus cycloheptanicus]WDM00691.1 hypothetical protein JI721_13435 [Alicyclobacillus cycloheptanicus]